MSWFRKEPPPPPKPKVSAWVIQLLVPVIFAIIMAMAGFIVNGIASDVEMNRKEKADNNTVILYIEKQKETDERQWKVIEHLLQQRQQQSYEPAPPQNVEVKKDTEVKKEEKPILSPKEFKEYLQLNAKEKEAFRSLHPSYKSLPK